MTFQRYMNCPLSLNERQTLIYKKLNERCSDYNNMTVSYTSKQLCTDIECIDLTVRIVNSELKKMIEKGVITIVKKGRKGNPTKYKIIKISSLNATNKYSRSNLNVSNFNEHNNKLVTFENVNGDSNVTPYNNIEKEKYTNEINYILSIYPKNDGRIEAAGQIIQLLEKYDYKELYRCVERYTIECKGKELKYIQGAKRFFKDGYINYLDENYKEISTYIDNLNII